MPELCRVDLWTRKGWWTSHHGVSLQDPEKYAERLGKNGKLARVSILNDSLQPEREFYTPGGELL